MDLWLCTKGHSLTDNMPSYESLKNNNILSCLSNCEKDPGMNSFLSASLTGSILSCCFLLSALADRLKSS